MNPRIEGNSGVGASSWINGKRHLERAIALWKERHPGEAVEVHWHPFELNPDLPAGGVARRAYLEAKFGGAERTREIYARVAAAGLQAGIAFDFERIGVQPNTLDAHRLVAWAAERGDENAMVEALFHGYFMEGRDYSARAQLAAVAGLAGFPEDEAHVFLESGAGAEMIKADEQVAARMGVSGVPFFIFDQRLALSGAQPPEVILQAMEEAREGGP
ncbi:MAG: DsbA family oxidoreductase [Betaproteobacteria bacterium]